jgi:protein-tyrosine phosphatase
VIDLHAHVLPGIDDGPYDLHDAVALSAAAVRDGIRTMAATPHIRPDHPGVRPRELEARVESLQLALRRAGVALEVVQGGELDLVLGLDADDEVLRAVSLGGHGTDLLVETPYGAIPPAFDAQLFRLAARGYRLLLAHPERNPTLQRSPERLARIVERGVLLQVTAGALASGAFRSRSRKLALDLVREGLAHVIATDTHAARGSRSPALRAGVKAAARVAPERAEWMVTEAPAAILAGEPLPSAPPPHGGWRGRIRGY